MAAEEKATPLHFVLNEIASTHGAGLFYASLVLALTLPDICSALELSPTDPKKPKIHERYKDWCERYAEKHLSNLTSEDLWVLRSNVVHHGQTFGREGQRYDRVVFILPDGNNNKFQVATMNVAGDSEHVCHISVDVFCQALIDAALEWLRDKNNDVDVQGRMENLIRFRPNGYKNHLVGPAVIA